MDRNAAVITVTRDRVLRCWMAGALHDFRVVALEPQAAPSAPATASLIVLDDECVETVDSAALEDWLRCGLLVVLVRRHDPERVAELLDRGAADVLCEPFVSAELRARVLRALRSRHLVELRGGRALHDAWVDSRGFGAA